MNGQRRDPADAASRAAAPVAADEAVEIVFDFDDFPSLVGRSFQGHWFSVDKEKLPLFDAATYADENPYVFDGALYGEGLVEGFHLLALLDHLSNPLLRLRNGSLTGWNYGFDRMRFTSPVRAGTPVRLRGVVGSVRPRGEGHLILLNCTLEIQGQVKPALVADWWVLYMRPSAGTNHSPSSDPGRSTT
jgi:acyl dehydratase